MFEFLYFPGLWVWPIKAMADLLFIFIFNKYHLSLAMNEFVKPI